MAPALTSLVTTAPAPTMAPSPMVTPGRMVALAPMEAPLVLNIGALNHSSWGNVVPVTVMKP